MKYFKCEYCYINGGSFCFNASQEGYEPEKCVVSGFSKCDWQEITKEQFLRECE